MTKLSTILIIDDEKDLVKLLGKKIKENGHEVLVAFDGEEGIEKSKLNPDLILLDIMMPKIDGFEVCQKIRDNVVCPIIFLSARQSETDKIRGFNLGGDDYITKPFGLRELLAKIEANLRREKRSQYLNEENKRRKLYFGNLSLDIKDRVVEVCGKDIPLTKTEYEIVELLALNAGQVFTKEQIYEQIWHEPTNNHLHAVENTIFQIRKRLKPYCKGHEYIKTVIGYGYKFNSE